MTAGSAGLEFGGRDVTAQLLNGSTHQLAPGTLVLGRFYIEGMLGKGGMSNVYLARDQHFDPPNNHCALKEMIARDDVDTSLSNFKREANVLASLRHVRIPRVYDSFTIYHRAYLALDYIEGHDLGAVLHASSSGVIEPDLVVDWMLQLCNIVEYLHLQPTPIVFRDFKPSNIMLTLDGHIMLIDFGIAKAMQPARTGTSVGTKGYAAKEMYDGYAEQRSDIYSLGAMMHHLLTGMDPSLRAPFTFHEYPIRSYNPAVPPALDAVVMKCVEQQLENRYQNIHLLRQAIEEAAGFRAYSKDTQGLVRHDDTTPNIAVRIPPSEKQRGRATSLLWRYGTEGEIRSTPALRNGSVFIGSYDNNVHAVDSTTGKMQWKFPTQGGICGTPTFWRTDLLIGSQDFSIYAIDTKTGKEHWKYRTWQRVHSSPRIYENRLYIGSDDMYVHAIEPEEGTMLWREQTFREVWSSAAYDNGLLYIGSNDGSLYALDAITGQHKWRFRTQAEIASTPCVADGHVYVGSYDFAVYSVEAKSGYQAWRTTTNGYVLSSPLVVKDRVYIGSTDKNLYCLDRITGEEIWKYTTGGQVNSTPVFADDMICFGSNDGHVYALDTKGQLRWKYLTGGIVPGSPLVQDGVVYIGSSDGYLYALRANV